MKNRVSFFCLHTCLLLFSFWTMYPALGHAADGNVISRLKFKQISTLDGLPTDEVQKIYQDKEGFLWFEIGRLLLYRSVFLLSDLLKGSIYHIIVITVMNTQCSHMAVQCSNCVQTL